MTISMGISLILLSDQDHQLHQKKVGKILLSKQHLPLALISQMDLRLLALETEIPLAQDLFCLQQEAISHSFLHFWQSEYFLQGFICVSIRVLLPQNLHKYCRGFIIS